MRNAAALHGRPTMVIASRKVASSQASPERKPPKMNQRMLRTSAMAPPCVGQGWRARPHEAWLAADDGRTQDTSETDGDGSMRAMTLALAASLAIFMAPAGLALPGAARAASFDCAKASAPTDVAICSNPTLSAMDSQL